jgi:hypothetical protein
VCHHLNAGVGIATNDRPRPWQNFDKTDLPEIVFQQLIEFLTAVSRKSLADWSRLMDHRIAERVVF